MIEIKKEMINCDKCGKLFLNDIIPDHPILGKLLHICEECLPKHIKECTEKYEKGEFNIFLGE